jgi:hypothetical protein
MTTGPHYWIKAGKAPSNWYKRHAPCWYVMKMSDSNCHSAKRQIKLQAYTTYEAAEADCRNSNRVGRFVDAKYTGN